MLDINVEFRYEENGKIDVYFVVLVRLSINDTETRLKHDEQTHTHTHRPSRLGPLGLSTLGTRCCWCFFFYR